MIQIQHFTWLTMIFLGLILLSLQTLALAATNCEKDKPIIIAVIDTGIDLDHPDLRNWIWTNPGESGVDAFGNDKATNGIDDDDNGFVDDLHGWNFIKNNADIRDHHGHGTHVSGLITKYWPDVLSRGPCPRLQLMVLKYFDQQFLMNDTLESSIKSFRYAIQNGAKILNFSGGGAKKSKAEEEIIRLAEQKGILLVAAAGNEGSNTDQYHFYPANYPLSNIFSVAALNKENQLLHSSNYGINTVKFAAEGENLKSSLPGGLHGVMTGTSQATALTTGIAALIQMKNPWLNSPEKLIQRLVQAGKKNSSLEFKTENMKQLNIVKSLRSRDRHISSFDQSVQNANFFSEDLFLDNHYTASALKISDGI